MEWLKTALGEENYNKLNENGSIDILKKSLGDNEYIANDKDKWIEKHVFNTQREELKNLKIKIENYEKELNDRSDLITDEDHKKILGQKEIDFKNSLLDMENKFKSQLELKEKENLLINLLTSSGCKKTKYILNSVNYDDVLIKDGQIINSNQIVEGYKKDVPELFASIQSNVPNRNEGDNNKTTKEQLIDKYNKMPSGAGKMALQRQIKSLEESK